MEYDIKDIGLADAGRRRIDWAWAEMPVLRHLYERFTAQRPLQGLRVSGCLHITTETANLARVLKAGGADLLLCASNPLSTQDDVAASLVRDHAIPVFAVCGEDNDRYYRHIVAALSHRPRVTLDDGADLVSELHKRGGEALDSVIGGTEETTTGVIRLRAMAHEGALKFPINFTVVGYGWCGRGIATRAHGHGAHVIVCEVDPVRALEATMDGYRVMPLEEAARLSDFIITATGDKHVIDQRHLAVMKDGCVIGNSGHFNVEINIPALQAMASERQRPRPHVDEYRLTDGRRIRLLAEGRLVNLAAAEGHPAAVMDMSFANQALCVAYLAQHRLETAVHQVPRAIDQEVAQLKLAALGLTIDTLTDEQDRYLASWREGT